MAIALIACSRKKADGVARGKANEIYDSVIFNKSYEWAKQKVGEKNIYILSAKYHVLEPDDTIEKYSKYLSDYDSDYRKAWTDEVMNELRRKGVLDEKGVCREKCYMLAGEDYIQYLRDCFPDRVEVFDKRRFCQIMKYLNRELPKNESMRSLKDYIREELDDSRRSSNATPRNTTGMGNPMLPGGYIDSRRSRMNPTSAKAFYNQHPGSGDTL